MRKILRGETPSSSAQRIGFPALLEGRFSLRAQRRKLAFVSGPQRKSALRVAREGETLEASPPRDQRS